MAKITRVEGSMVDLVPKVKRTDAIQSFVSQETPIIRIFDADGGIGTGYSYTIGTGGPSVMKLIERSLARELAGEVTLAFDPVGLRCHISAPLTDPAD